MIVKAVEAIGIYARFQPSKNAEKWSDQLACERRFLTMTLFIDFVVRMQRFTFQGVFSDALQSVLSLCLRLDPNARPDVHRIKNYLEAFSTSTNGSQES